MKVRRAGSDNLFTIADTHDTGDHKAPDLKEANFQSQLQRAEQANHEEHIRALVEKIAAQGKKLAEKVDIRELKVYKDLVSEFLEEAVGGSGRFSKQNFLDRRGRHRIYAMVKKINTELEQLTVDVLNEEKEHIGILRRLEDIRGLIMDIVL